MKANYCYTERARAKYLARHNLDQKKFSSDYFANFDIDLTREYCEVAIECNSDIVRNGSIDDLVGWVMIHSYGKLESLYVKECLLEEFEYMAFSYHKD